MTHTIIGLIPMIIMQCIYSFVNYFLARKCGRRGWVWFLLALIPFLGAFFSCFLLINALMRAHDRIAALEIRLARDLPNTVIEPISQTL
jgi:hypothetical protein